MSFVDLLSPKTSGVAAILLTEASECGLACLAMIATHHGHHVELSGLRRRFSISPKGATFRDLIQIGNHIGLASRPLRLELNELPQLRVPCILHWDLNHFVVLAKADKSGVTINDPAFGVRHIPYETASRHFTGVALEMTKTAEFKPAAPAPRISPTQFLGQLSGLQRSLTQLFTLALAIEIFAMISPMFLGWIVDHALVAGDRDLITTLAIAFLLLICFQTALSTMRSWMLMGLNASLKVQSRANLFTHLVELPAAWFEARNMGDVMSRFASQETILQTLTSELVEGVLDGLMALLTLVIMLMIAPDLTFLVLLGTAAYAFLRWAFYTPLRHASVEALVWGAKRDSHFLETLRGVRTIKIFNGQEDRRARWLNLLVETVNRQLTSDKLRLIFKTSNALLMGVMKVLILFLGARKVLDGGFSVGLLLVFIAYKDQFQDRISELINKVVDLTMLRLHTERLADIVLTPREKRGLPAPTDTRFIPVSIEARGIRHRYGDNDPWILDNVSFRIEAGESVAIVGNSGGGKTTLLKILAGLVQPTEGEIFVNGEPVSRLGLSRFRSMMGVVMQDDQLFAGSIAENISFFSDRPDFERIQDSARRAAVADDIDAMPMAYDTLIGDMGASLSGGQKQRVLIARALYRRPSVLLLDEATSHLDVNRERMVNLTLRDMKMTRIVVAHRPETIRAAERVLVLEGGLISSQTDMPRIA